MPDYRITVKASGPLFDGMAPARIDEFMHKATRRVAETGQDWIKIAANEMDRSGRGGTGRAAEGVVLYERDVGYAIFGEMKEGDVWWPWLEGTSQRNTSTRFKGYHTFRSVRMRLSQHLQEIVRPLVDDLIRELGGGGLWPSTPPRSPRSSTLSPPTPSCWASSTGSTSTSRRTSPAGACPALSGCSR